MKVVLDTNVLVSALLFGGTPLDVVSLAQSSAIDVVTSETALSELLAVLSRPRFRERLRSIGVSARTLVSRYRALAVITEPAPLPGLCEDPADDEFIALGIAADADVIVSGDRHLLACAKTSPILIVTAAELLKLLRELKA